MDSLELSNKVRIDVLNMTSSGGSSHIGSCYSIVDILSVLYSRILKFNPSDSKDNERDYLILSKGHAGAALYSVLARVGFFTIDKLKLHYKNGSPFSGHVSHIKIDGVEFSTGSLGHGLSVGVGLAYGIMLNNKFNKVFVILSDGELNEGSNWEPIMFAPHHKINNLIVIIDKNNLQSLDTTEKTLSLGNLCDKFKIFGWSVLEIDGHNHNALFNSINSISSSDRPTIVIANTIKGKGVSFMENNVLWHYRSAKGAEFSAAMNELSAK